MQHIVHIFVGEELSGFRNQFASIFHHLHPDIEPSLFSAVSVTESEEGALIFDHDGTDTAIAINGLPAENLEAGLHNFFENLYSHKITVAHPGNRTLVVMLWAQLFNTDHSALLSKFIKAINGCPSKISVEVTGFTHDAVSCFVPEIADRLDPDFYRQTFENNINALRQMRSSLAALRLIANRNMQGVALDFTPDTMARICAEYAAILCRHYLTIHPTVVESQYMPYESFGISSIKFDRQYYSDYITNRTIIDMMRQQDIDRREFNINSLAQKTNPVIQTFLADIRDFYSKQAIYATAKLSLEGQRSASNIVGSIETDLEEMVSGFKAKINALIEADEITLFEGEALLSLILGDDCSMFSTSAVSADETTIDDLINESCSFFTSLDYRHEILADVKQSSIKDIRTSMRNIAVANRQRYDRLEAIECKRNELEASQHHINDNKYSFGGVDYELNLTIDSEPLQLDYTPHAVTIDSIDLRAMFMPVRNQGPQGCCAAFAVSSVIEAMSHSGSHLSPAFLYWNARVINNCTDSDSGTTMLSIIKAATDKGACPEEDMPFDAAVWNVAPSAAAISSALSHRVVEARNVKPEVAAIKSALADGHPVIIASRIFDSFSDTASGFVSHPTKSDLCTGRSDNHGCHAMVVCGFSDKERVLVTRNSWGTDFGDQGYCYIPYSYADKYFLQACIITEVSNPQAATQREFTTPQTLNFNINDSNIEAAILQNLIAEDQFKLEALAEESSRLKTDWTRNVTLLGNVNNQKTLIENAQNNLHELINDEQNKINELQNSKNAKLAEFRKSGIKAIISSVSSALTFLILLLVLPNIVTVILSAIASLVMLFIIGQFSWRYKQYRQQLIDEIQSHAYAVDKIRERLKSLDIKAHIHSKILKEIGDYRIELMRRNNKIHEFNAEMVDTYTHLCAELKQMTPEVPYPFLGVLENKLLDRYYDAWKHKISGSIDLRSTLEHFKAGNSLRELLNNSQALKDAVLRGLKGFSMKEYVSRSNYAKWNFLPDSSDVSELLPDLDNRSIPFTPYSSFSDGTIEKYILVKDITTGDMMKITPYFHQPPMPISISDPDSITILQTVRYNIQGA